MPITPEQREQRRKHIGSSDSSAIVGLNPWAGPYDVFIEKTQQTEDIDENRRMVLKLGNVLEPALLDWAAQELGVTVLRNVSRVCESQPILASNLDGKVMMKPEGLEAKTTGILNPMFRGEDWGEAETDQVPNHVTVQCQHHCLVHELDWVWVPALIQFRGLVMFRVPRNDRIIQHIVDRDVQFWHGHVVPRVPPPPVPPPSLELLRRIRREPEKSVQIAPRLVAEYQAAKALEKSARQQSDRAQALLLAALEDAEGATFEGGTLTYFEQQRKGYTVEPTSYRALRVKGSPGDAGQRDDCHAEFERAHELLMNQGATLDDVSDSGSRYYTLPGGQKVRVSDHQPNEATANWMERCAVRSVLVNDPYDMQSLEEREQPAVAPAECDIPY